MVSERGWAEDLFRPLTVAVMIGAVALSVMQLVSLFFPQWNGQYLVIFCGLVALEAQYSHWLLQDRTLDLGDKLKYRFGEHFALYFLMQLGENLTEGRLLEGIPRFDLDTLASYALVFLCWTGSTNTAHDLTQLGEPPEHHNEYVSPESRMVSRFFIGGVVLVLMSGVARIGLDQMVDLSRGSVSGPVLNVLIYFVLGVVMQGQMRYAVLHRRWREQGVGISERLTGRWVRYSVVFLGVVAALSLLLPTSYTMGILDVLGLLVGLVMMVLSLISGLFLLLIGVPIGWLMALLSGESYDPPPAPRPQLPRPPQSPAGTSDLGDWLRSVGFWLVLLLVLVYLVRTYLVRYPGLWGRITRFGPAAVVAGWGRAFWQALRAYAGTVREHLPRDLLSRLPRRTTGGRARRGIRGGPLSPREEVLSLYRGVLSRAGRLGMSRSVAQTPYEYGASLGPRLPSGQPELGSLTERFVEAYYSPHEVDAAQADHARVDAERVEEALEDLRQQQAQGTSGSRDEPRHETG